MKWINLKAMGEWRGGRERLVRMGKGEDGEEEEGRGW